MSTAVPRTSSRPGLGVPGGAGVPEASRPSPSGEVPVPSRDCTPLNVFGELTAQNYLAMFRAEGIALEPFRADVTRNSGSELAAARRYLAKQPGPWRSSLELAAERLPQLGRECRMQVLLPCRFEERRIGPCLAALHAQSSAAPGASETFELVILDNVRSGEQFDATSEVVQRFVRERRPSFPIHYVRRELQPSESSVALSAVRKYLADLALLRLTRRPASAEAHYLASFDADVVQIDSRGLAKVTTTFDAHPWIDALRGTQDRQPQIMMHSPLLFLERRSWGLAELLLSARKYWPDRHAAGSFVWNRTVTGGWNTFFSTRVYAEIGGYSPRRILEDVDIGNRISVLRGRHLPGGGFVPDVRSIRATPVRMQSSPVRFMQALLGDYDPYSAEREYEAFFGASAEHEVRHARVEDLLESLRVWGDPVLHKARYDRVLTRLRAALEDIDAANADRVFRRVMFLLGFIPSDFELTGSRLVVHDYARFLRLVEAYRTRSSRTP